MNNLHPAQQQRKKQHQKDLHNADWFYRMGKSFAKAGNIEHTLRCFNDAFFVRGHEPDCCCDNEWKRFHDIQFSIYLLGKKRLCISLPEGDMIHDIIHMKWLEIQQDLQHSPFGFATENTSEWYKTVKIDFPWELCDEEIMDISMNCDDIGANRHVANGTFEMIGR